MTVVEDIQELLPYGCRTVVFFSLMSFIYMFPIDWVRTLIIYTPTAFLMWKAEGLLVFGYLLAIAHGLVHQIFPFINDKGINTDYTPAWDVLVHFLMLIYSIYLVDHFPSTKSQQFLTRIIAWVMVLGSALNVITSIFCSATDVIFVQSSAFQALSSGAWVFSHLIYTTKYNKFYLPIGALTLAISMFNWFLFRANSDVMADAFVNRYFETLFIIPTWIFAYLNAGNNKLATSGSVQ